MRMRAWANTQAERVVFSSAKRFVIPSEVACQAVALCEGWSNPAPLPIVTQRNPPTVLRAAQEDTGYDFWAV